MALKTGLQLPYGIQPVNPFPVDSWSGPYEGLTETIAKNAANTSIPSSIRFKSMEVRLIINGSSKKYWYANGILDSDLVEFFPFEVADSRYFPLTGGTIGGNTKVQGNLTVYGDLSSTGNSYFANTIYSTTSALSVINVGNTGPALYIANNGSGDLASFYDLDTNAEVFHIGGANGSFPNIGVKTSTPNKDLTVNGEISAYGSIWTSGDFISGGREIFSVIYPDINKGLDTYSNVNSNSANWDSVYTTVSSNSATYATYNYVDSNFLNLTGGVIDGNLSVLSSFEVGSGDTMLFVSGGKVGINTETPNAELTINGSISSNATIYDLLGNSQQWNSVYTTVKSNSANSDSTYTLLSANSATWDSVYTSVKNTSANWDSVYSSVLNTSANWDSVYNNVNSLSSNWDSVYTSVSSVSSNWNSVYNNVNSLSSNWQTAYAYVSANSVNLTASNIFVNNNLTVTNTVSANYFKGTIIDWMTLTRGFKTEPTFNSTIAGGDVYNYVYESFPIDKTYYRYIAADGSEDAYYETFSSGNLSNLIAKKKIIV